MNKNCVVYLVDTRNSDINDFINSVGTIERFFIKNNPSDIICFHEESLNPYLVQIQSHINLPVIFKQVDFFIPTHNKDLEIPEVYYVEENNAFSLGYRHMCRFFAGEIFKQEILNSYDYYMRMDSDSFLTKEVPYNIFNYMQSNKKYYGYLEASRDYDHPNAASGFWSIGLDWYQENKNICYKEPFKDIPELLLYNTNFEICNIEYFKSSKYMDFYNFVDKTGGIYTKRWGDHIIKMLGVGMTFNDENKHSITDFGYRHGSLVIN